MVSLNDSVVIVRDSTGNTGVDVLRGVERLRFSDQSLAFDIGGNAGKVARILGAVFGKESVANAEYAGIGLQLLDEGMSYGELMMLALNTKLGAGFSDVDEVRLLYQNLVGSQPSQADLDYWTGTIASGQYTQASLGIMAAELELNANNINLTGLAKTGLAYHD
jgi:serralysin